MKTLNSREVDGLELWLARAEWRCEEHVDSRSTDSFDSCHCGKRMLPILPLMYVMLTLEEYMELLRKRNDARRTRNG